MGFLLWCLGYPVQRQTASTRAQPTLMIDLVGLIPFLLNYQSPFGFGLNSIQGRIVSTTTTIHFIISKLSSVSSILHFMAHFFWLPQNIIEQCSSGAVTSASSGIFRELQHLVLGSNRGMENRGLIEACRSHDSDPDFYSCFAFNKLHKAIVVSWGDYYWFTWFIHLGTLTLGPSVLTHVYWSHTALQCLFRSFGLMVLSCPQLTSHDSLTHLEDSLSPPACTHVLSCTRLLFDREEHK